MGEPARRLYSWREYLELEAVSEIRHEYREGEIVAMAGGSRRHSRLAVRMGGLLEQRLGFAGPCRVYNGDARVRVLATGRGTYPDVSVVCGDEETDPHSAETLTNPSVIIEVLSESTEAYDRGDKFFHFQQIPSLRDYVLVSQDRRQVDHFRRGPDGGWHAVRLGLDDELLLSACEARIAIADLYAGILDEDAPEPEGVFDR